MSAAETPVSSPSRRADRASRQVLQRMEQQSSGAAIWFPAGGAFLRVRGAAPAPPTVSPLVDELTALALAARDGDRVALSAFVRATWGDVARLVTAVAGADLAEDAAQDAYLRAIKSLPKFRAESGARTWLLAIARRAGVDAVRSASRRRRLARLVAAGSGPEPATVALGDGALVEQVLARLEPDRRTAFVLTQLLGFDYAGAAEVCGCPVGTIRSRVARARDQLMVELGPLRASEPDPGEPGEPVPQPLA